MQREHEDAMQWRRNKSYWEIKLDGCCVLTRSGRISPNNRYNRYRRPQPFNVVDYDCPIIAINEFNKRVVERERAGYKPWRPCPSITETYPPTLAPTAPIEPDFDDLIVKETLAEDENKRASWDVWRKSLLAKGIKI